MASLELDVDLAPGVLNIVAGSYEPIIREYSPETKYGNEGYDDPHGHHDFGLAAGRFFLRPVL